MKALDNKITHADEKLRELEEQKAIQQSKVDQVGGNELTEARKAHELAKKDHDVIEIEAERIRAEVKKSEETVKNREKENQELLKKIQTLNLQRAHLVEEKAKAEQNYFEGLQKKSELTRESTTLKEKQHELGESSQKWLVSMQQIKGQLDSINSNIESEQKTLENIKSDFGKIKEDLEQNRKKFIDFVATFSIIEELKRFDKREGAGDNGDDDGEEDEDGDTSFSNTQANKRNRTQRSAMKRKDVGPSAKKRRDNLEISSITPDREITREELEELGFDIEKVRAEITMLKNLKMNLSTDTEVIQLFQQRLTDYMNKASQLKQVTERESNLRSELAKLKDKRRVEFMTGFSFIAKTLKNVYQTITQGGDADLEPIDNSDPFASGISFNVRPPQKSWKQMSKLSGGEKTLSSLSLIFALHYYKPTPIYFMDEIDAALDFRNVEIVAKFIKERTKDAQFIVISLRNHMFELASQLIGIYKTQDTTKTISIYPHPIVEQVNEEMRRELNESKPGHRLSRRSQAYGTQDASAIKSKGFAQSLKARLSVAGHASQADSSQTKSRPQGSYLPDDKENSSSRTNTRGANPPAVTAGEPRSSARTVGRAGSERSYE